MPHISSSQQNDIEIILFTRSSEKDKISAYVPTKSVLIKGKQSQLKREFAFEIPSGVVTSVTDDELKLLKANNSFNRYVSKGYFQIISDKDGRYVAEESVIDLSQDDKSNVGNEKLAENELDAAGISKDSISMGDVEA